MTLFRWFTFLLRFQTMILIVLTILMLIWMALGIISEMFHRRIYLNLVLLLLLVNFVSGFRLELMYISLIKNIRSSLIHLHSAACAPAIVQRNHFFPLHQIDKSDSKSTFRQATNCWKRVLEAAKVAYANKTKGSITSQKLSSQDFWWTANSVLNKCKPPLFNDPEVLSSGSDKAKLFVEKLSKNSNLGDTGIFFTCFHFYN